jgi:hypothetical protein
MALTQSRPAELKRYKFFVSRRLEDGRERFRLHMGYFDSMLQAEELLPLVRDIYPGAWAGETPGKRLRARAAAADLKPEAAPPMAPPPTAAPAIDEPPMAAPAELELLENSPSLALQADPAPAAPPVLTAAAAPAGDAETARPAASKRDAKLPFDRRSNVREVMKSLDEPADPAAKLPESQVLGLLEDPHDAPSNTVSAPAAFAVQLQMSVQRIDMASVPPLAIFTAYTLYTVEGTRQGRRWYGLRLGFFKDADAAKQVAQYVRSEFKGVAVVPVTLKERDGASSSASGPAPAPGTPLERLPEDSAEIKLMDDIAETPKVSDLQASALDGPAKATKTVKHRGHRVNAREKRSAKSLEETLEILGADELQIEGTRKKSAGASAARQKDVKVQKNSPFSRLLERLAERNR